MGTSAQSRLGVPMCMMRYLRATKESQGLLAKPCRCFHSQAFEESTKILCNLGGRKAFLEFKIPLTYIMVIFTSALLFLLAELWGLDYHDLFTSGIFYSLQEFTYFHLSNQASTWQKSHL